MTVIEIGHLLRAGTTGCVVGCSVSQISAPQFGGMVRINPEGSGDYHIYGLITNIHIDDDGLVRQLVTAADIKPEIISDNRMNRNVPVEISVLFIGYAQQKAIYHLLPPRPPLTLDAIYLCTPVEHVQFTGAGHFGYFRHILRASDLPVGELLAAHLRQVTNNHKEQGNPEWLGNATQELITLLRDDYPTLMSVLGALSDTRLNY